MIILERNNELEKSIGVNFDKLSYFIEKTNIEEQKFHIYGEFSMENYEDYKFISFEAIFYDENEEIIYIDSSGEFLNNFLGQGSFHIWSYLSLDMLNKIKKIKVSPKSIEKKLTQNQIKSGNRITLETDQLLLKILVKKDYSLCSSFNEKRDEFIDDVNYVIDKFTQSKEFKQFMKK